MQAQNPSQQSSSLSANLGKYRLILRLAQGGMGDVYLAVHKGPGGFYKLAVVKELRSAFTEDGTSLRMFLDEARLAARLSHPNVVQTNEVACEDGRHFMVMEYLEGKPFQHILKRLGPTGAFPWAYRVYVLCEALKGLHYAHELRDFDGTAFNVVHRDFTPHNIFVTFEGVVKVLDFGIAKAIDSQETRTGMIKGKFAYMAPEQAMGKAVDRRTDVFSAGVVLWEAITGRRMWPNLSEVQILMRVVKDSPPSPREVNPDVPEELARICMRALERNPDDRYDTAEQMRLELENFLDSRQLSATPAEVGALLSKGFEGDRQRIRAIIEGAMRELRATSDDSTVVAVPVEATGTHSTIRPSIGATPGVPGMTDVRDLSHTNSGSHPGASMSFTSLPMPSFSVRGTPKRGRGAMIGLGLGVAALAAGGLYLAFGRESATPVNDQQATAQATNSPQRTPAASGVDPTAALTEQSEAPVQEETPYGEPSAVDPSGSAEAATADAVDRARAAKLPLTSEHAERAARAKASAEAAHQDAPLAPTTPAVVAQKIAPGPEKPTTPATSTAAPAPTVMAFGTGMNRPMMISGRDPVYTPEARDAKVEGTMVARCTITTSGSVTGCKVLKSLPYMEKSVLDALYSRHYTPIVYDGKPVAVNYVFNIRVVSPK